MNRNVGPARPAGHPWGLDRSTGSPAAQPVPAGTAGPTCSPASSIGNQDVVINPPERAHRTAGSARLPGVSFLGCWNENCSQDTLGFAGRSPGDANPLGGVTSLGCWNRNCSEDTIGFVSHPSLTEQGRSRPSAVANAPGARSRGSQSDSLRSWIDARMGAVRTHGQRRDLFDPDQSSALRRSHPRTCGQKEAPDNGFREVADPTLLGFG
jgi:hypothetical protein